MVDFKWEKFTRILFSRSLGGLDLCLWTILQNNTLLRNHISFTLLMQQVAFKLTVSNTSHKLY